MKRLAVVTAVLVMILCFQGTAIAQVQEKGAMKEQIANAPAKAGPAAWKNFKKPDDATLKKMLTPPAVPGDPEGGDGTPLPERV